MDGINPDGLYSPRQVSKLDNVCLATVYLRLARGEYEAFKDGHKTMIPGSGILSRRRARLTPAHFKPQPAAAAPNRFHTIRHTSVPE